MKSRDISDFLIKTFLWGLAFLIILNGLILYLAGSIEVMPDYVSYLTGALMVKGQEGNIYNLDEQINIQKKILGTEDLSLVIPFRNPPFVALLFLPFSYLYFYDSYLILALINIFLLILFIYLAKKEFNLPGKLHLLPLIFVTNFITILLGQISFILLLVHLLVYKFLKTKEWFISGMLAGLIFIKPQYLIIVPYLAIISGNKKLFWSGFLTSIFILIGASILVGGFGSLLAYPTFLLNTEKPNFGSDPQYMFSLLSLFGSITPFSFSGGLIFALSAILFIASLLLLAKNASQNNDFVFASAILFSLVFSWHTNIQDLVLLQIPILLMLKRFIEVKKPLMLRLWLLEWIFLLSLLPFLLFSKFIILSPFIMLAAGFYLMYQKKKYNHTSEV